MALLLNTLALEHYLAKRINGDIAEYTGLRTFYHVMLFLNALAIEHTLKKQISIAIVEEHTLFEQINAAIAEYASFRTHTH